MAMKYKLGVGINYWDDPKGLLTLLEAPNFLNQVYVVYIIDGRYTGRSDFEENNPYLGKEIASGYPKVHYICMFNVKQIDKRNKYWELAEKDQLDFMIVLDSDETCIFGEGLNQSLDECMKYDSQCFPLNQDHVQVTKMARPRLFKKPFTFRHKEHKGPNISHGSLWDGWGKGKQEIINQMYRYHTDPNTPKTVPGILLTHDKEYRTKARLDADYEFYENNPTR